MVLLTVLLIGVAAVAAVATASVLLGRHLGRQLAGQGEAQQRAALDAARVALDQAVADRDAVLRQAVDTAVSVAGDKFRDQLTAGGRELDLRTETFEQHVGGLSDQLHRMTDLVSTLERQRAEQHGQVVEGLEQAARSHASLSETTQQLRQALASPKARGQWGERMADDVLRLVGLVEGVNYRKQVALAGGTIPDFTFVMPQGLELNMDVKFPVDNYLRYLEADTDPERVTHRKAFLRDVRQRVNELTTRDYIEPGRTVNCVLLFIPNESIYSFIHEHDAGVTDHALGSQVLLCSPFTLFAVLGVVRQSIDSFVLQRTSDEILECLGGFRKEWDKFGDHLDRVGKQFDTAHKSLESLSGTRRRVLERHLDRVDDLRTRRGIGDGDPLDDPLDDPARDPGDEGEVRFLRDVSAG